MLKSHSVYLRLSISQLSLVTYWVSHLFGSRQEKVQQKEAHVFKPVNLSLVSEACKTYIYAKKEKKPNKKSLIFMLKVRKLNLGT